MKIYLKINKENIITDAIEYAHEGYVEKQIDEIPVGINGGWFKWENEQLIEDQALKPINSATELQQRISDLEQAMAAMLGGAV